MSKWKETLQGCLQWPNKHKVFGTGKVGILKICPMPLEPFQEKLFQEEAAHGPVASSRGNNGDVTALHDVIGKPKQLRGCHLIHQLTYSVVSPDR